MTICCLDACVLYPTVLREVLIGLAWAGHYRPLWSARILEEWARAADRRADGTVARAEIARLRADWPTAEGEIGEAADLWLPDAHDIHVLAASRTGGAEKIITLNLRDFPTRELAPHGIEAQHPDAFLMALWLENPEAVQAVVAKIHAQAETLSGQKLPLRALMKRARLPRLGKALTR